MGRLAQPHDAGHRRIVGADLDGDDVGFAQIVLKLGVDVVAAGSLIRLGRPAVPHHVQKVGAHQTRQTQINGVLPVQPKALGHQCDVALVWVALKVGRIVQPGLGRGAEDPRQPHTGRDAVAQRHIGELRLRFAVCLCIGGQGGLLLGRRCGLLLLHLCRFGSRQLRLFVGSKCRHGQQHKRCCCGQKAGKFFVFHCDSFFPGCLHRGSAGFASMIKWKAKIVN